MKAFQIPLHHTMPSDRMIDFLNECPQPWDGDSSGINITMQDGTEMVGGPGDWVVAEGGVYRIMTSADYDKMENEHDAN